MFVIECGKRVFQRVAALTRLLARILSWMQRAIRDGTPGTAEDVSTAPPLGHSESKQMWGTSCHGYTCARQLTMYHGFQETTERRIVPIRAF